MENKTIEQLIEHVANFSISKPEDHSGRELYYACKELNDAVNALRDLVLAQQELINQLLNK